MTDEQVKEFWKSLKNYQMTEGEREAQMRSFVYGNLKIENASITRELVDEVADEMARERRATT